jgi:hypothetical protein
LTVFHLDAGAASAFVLAKHLTPAKVRLELRGTAKLLSVMVLEYFLASDWYTLEKFFAIHMTATGNEKITLDSFKALTSHIGMAGVGQHEISSNFKQGALFQSLFMQARRLLDSAFKGKELNKESFDRVKHALLPNITKLLEEEDALAARTSYGEFSHKISGMTSVKDVDMTNILVKLTAEGYANKHPKKKVALLAFVSSQADAAPIDATPIDAKPFDATPIDATPIDPAPAGAAPADATPTVLVQSKKKREPPACLRLTDVEPLPKEVVPAISLPLGLAPAGSTPARGSAPAGSMPAGSAPAGSMPAGSAPAGSAPIAVQGIGAPICVVDADSFRKGAEWAMSHSQPHTSRAQPQAQPAAASASLSPETKAKLNDIYELAKSSSGDLATLKDGQTSLHAKSDEHARGLSEVKAGQSKLLRKQKKLEEAASEAQAQRMAQMEAIEGLAAIQQTLAEKRAAQFRAQEEQAKSRADKAAAKQAAKANAATQDLENLSHQCQ